MVLPELMTREKTKVTAVDVLGPLLVRATSEVATDKSFLAAIMPIRP